MTCIVGIEDEAGAVIGGDAVYAAGWRRTNSAQPKVLRIGPAIIGGAGSTRAAQVMASCMRDLSWEPPSLDWFIDGFVPKIREALKAAGTVKTENGVEDWGGVLMVAHGPKVFTVWGDFQVEPPSRGYQAIGSGAEVAVGALHVSGRLYANPVERAILALEAASEHVASVGPPFTVEQVVMDRG